MAKTKEEALKAQGAVSAQKVQKVLKAEKPGRGKDKGVTVDTPYSDMLIWDKEGYNLRFSDKDGAMKELSMEELKGLSMDNRNLYYLSQAVSLGIDVGMVQKDYNVTPGSATDKMRLFGTDPNRVYRYESAKNIGAGASKGFTVDTDPNVTNSRGDVGIKYIGGQRNPEMVLTSARKEDVDAHKSMKKAKRDLMLDRNTEAYKETIARLGGKGTVEEVSR